MLTETNLTTRDGTILAAYAWRPDSKDIKASVVIIHGIGEHAMRYDEIAGHFTSLGMAVFSMDLRGHGKSPGKRGHTAPRLAILEDCDLLCQWASQTHPGIPVFVYGHSMGGNIGLYHRLHGSFRPQAYVITSPWLILYHRIPEPKVLAMKLIARLIPDLTVRSGINPKDITSDAEQEERYHKDGLCHGFISALTGVDCHTCAAEILKKAGEKRGELLLMHGTEDFICSIEGSRSLARGAGSDCTYREWPGCRHELHHDKDRAAVQEAMADWMLARV